MGEVPSAPVAPANDIHITPCKQRIRKNSHPLNNWPVLKRNILKLLERRHWRENNHSMVKRNDNFPEQTVTAGQTGKKEEDGIK